jgi:hypothetical protein
LRTTPARKPRTECCCQPVVFIITAIVAPVGDCSIAMTRDCLEPGSAFLLEVSSGAVSEGFAAITGAFEAADDFFPAFDIEILRSVEAALRRTTEAARRPWSQRGRISGRLSVRE